MADPKSVRLAEIIRRLKAAPAASTAGEAFRLLCTTIDAVEDQCSGVPNSPASFETDGRIYPPQDDNRKAVPGRPDLRRYRSLGHNTTIGDNGSITIVRLNGLVELDKPGGDGKGI